MSKPLYILLLLCAVCTVQASDLCTSLLSDIKMCHASIGIHIVDVDNNHVMVSYDADKALVPASIAKIVTAASVLKCYDDTTRWYTAIGYDGYIDDGVLHGNIIVRGSIDPSLAYDKHGDSRTRLLEELTDSVQNFGIRQVLGDIVADASICEMGGLGSLMLEDVGFYYGTACHGINYCGNEYMLYLNTSAMGCAPQIEGTSIPDYPMEYGNYLTVGKKDSSLVLATPYTSQTLLFGVVPQRQETFKLSCAIPDPPRAFASDISRALQSVGVDVKGGIVTHRDYIDEGREIPRLHMLLCKKPSKELSQMLRYMMHKSNNLYAETMLRYIGLTQDTVASVPRSLGIVHEMWRNEGLPVDEMNLCDGSGLSRKNTLTPRFMASLLVEAYRDSRLGENFVELFPQAGQEGSVQSFMKKNPLPGVLRLKSGSMSGVLCYAGYYTYDGHTYAVVLMSNNHSCKNSYVRSCYEKLLRDLWQ